MADSSIKTPIDPNQIGPVSVFDLQLKVLSESYIAFFQERLVIPIVTANNMGLINLIFYALMNRIKIEANYVDSLLKVHMKWKAVDSIYDDRTPSTVRRAWREVRGNLEREAETRAALVSSLRSDVLSPLMQLRESQDRTRKRIKEDLKTSISNYSQFAENELPKLKRSYFRKCQEVEDYKNAPHSALPSATSQIPQSPDLPAAALARNQSQSITTPVPLRPHRQPSLSQPTTRNRSPSGSTSFSDLAHHGKKQFNQLITFLGDGKGGNLREGPLHRQDGPLRGVRAKREADEADKEYRKGVHWLETLRLNRIKILESGYKSLELLIHESTQKIKDMGEVISNRRATAATTTQLSNHARESITQISATKDTLAVTSQTSRSMALATPPQTLYQNYYVGECKDLIFGVSLVDYTTARGLPDGTWPRVVTLCVKEIENRGLECEGIYRISGRHANVQELTHRMERDEAKFEFDRTTDDVYSISSLLKLYLRELPDPVFRFPLQDRLQYMEDRESHLTNNFRSLRSRIRRMVPVHQTTLKFLLDHLVRIAARHEKNKMDAKNLAIVFGPVIFGEDELPRNGDLLVTTAWKDCLMEDLILHAAILFEENSLDIPLPEVPVEEQQFKHDYGSSFTQVTSLPPKQVQLQSQPTVDFNPALPPRPDSSIHPSQRNQPSSGRDIDHVSLSIDNDNEEAPFDGALTLSQTQSLAEFPFPTELLNKSNEL